MGGICANFSGFVTAWQAPEGKREMERKPGTESGSFHVVWQADGKHELQRLLKRSAWGLCLQRDLTTLAGLKMLRLLLKSDVWEWNGVPALDQNIGEVHRNSTRQEQGQQGKAPINHSAGPERGLKASRTWSQGRERGVTPAKGSWIQTGIMSLQPGGATAAQEEREELGFVHRDSPVKQLCREQRYQNITSLSCKWDMEHWFPLMAWGSPWFTLGRTYGFPEFSKSPACKVSHRYLQLNEWGK